MPVPPKMSVPPNKLELPKKTESPFKREIVFVEANPPPPLFPELEPAVRPWSLTIVPSGAVAIAAEEIRQQKEVVVLVRDVSELDPGTAIPKKKPVEMMPRKGISMRRRIQEMEKRINGKEEPDLLAWRGVPRKLPRVTVRDIGPPLPAPMESDLHQIDRKPPRLEFADVYKGDTVFMLPVSKADGQPEAAQAQQPVHLFLRAPGKWRSQVRKYQKSRVLGKTNSSNKPP
jgi:hypothetical protein